MKATAKLTELKYVIELTKDEAEELLEYLGTDESACRLNNLIKTLKDAGVRDEFERTCDAKIKLPKYEIEV